MSKAKFEAARELIQEKKYDEARAILGTIDHPKAAEWIGKIDGIAPSEPVNIAKKSRRVDIILGAIVIALVLTIVIVWRPLISKLLGHNAVPDSIQSLSLDEQNQLLAKCWNWTKDLTAEPKVLDDAFKAFPAGFNKADWNTFGASTRFYVADRCSTAESFRALWGIKELILGKDMNATAFEKATAWSAFVEGWNSAQ